MWTQNHCPRVRPSLVSSFSDMKLAVLSDDLTRLEIQTVMSLYGAVFCHQGG